MRNKIRKTKKLLSEDKAFYLYKKTGNLLRDQDYLNLARKIKMRRFLANMKQQIIDHLSSSNDFNRGTISTYQSKAASKDRKISVKSNNRKLSTSFSMYKKNNPVNISFDTSNDRSSHLKSYFENFNRNKELIKRDSLRMSGIDQKQRKIKHVSKSLYTSPDPSTFPTKRRMAVVYPLNNAKNK